MPFSVAGPAFEPGTTVTPWIFVSSIPCGNFYLCLSNVQFLAKTPMNSEPLASPLNFLHTHVLGSSFLRDYCAHALISFCVLHPSDPTVCVPTFLFMTMLLSAVILIPIACLPTFGWWQRPCQSWFVHCFLKLDVEPDPDILTLSLFLALFRTS